MMRSRFIAASKSVACSTIGFVLFANVTLGGDWPQWRGPQGDSVSKETGLPIQWSEAKSVAWKANLPEWGASTPAIWGNALFVTSHNETTKELLLLKLDKRSGKIEWTRQVGSGDA